MAEEVSEIKSDGTGDYTSLAAWWAAVKTDTDPQWAECYDIGDIGTVVINGWAGTPSSSDYIRVYTELAERHNLDYGGGGAYIDCVGNVTGAEVWEDYTEVEGLRFTNCETAVATYEADECRTFSNFAQDTVSRSGNVWASNYTVRLDGATKTINAYVYNNVSASPIRTGAPDSVHILAVASGKSNPTINAYVKNNTAYGGYTSGMIATTFQPPHYAGTPTINLYLENNIADVSIDDYAAFGGGITVTANNNMSADDTADDWGGSGYLINREIEDQIKYTSGSYKLKASSDAIEAGKTQTDFTTDALNQNRPFGTSWCMGADEWQGTKVQIDEGVELQEGTEIQGD